MFLKFLLWGLLSSVARPVVPQDVIDMDVFGVIAPRNVSDMTYFGRQSNNTVRELKFEGDPQLWQGDQIIINNRKRRSLLQDDGDEVTDFIVLPRPQIPKDFDPITGTVKMTSITFLLRSELESVPFTADQFRQQWFNSYNRDGSLTFEEYFNNCSYGKTIFQEGDNILVDLLDKPVPVSGRTFYTNLEYDYSDRCGFLELYAWQEWGQKKYAEMMGGDETAIDRFQRRMVVTPVVGKCSWYGVGSHGCNGAFCYVWVRLDRWNFMNTFFHEVGHTMYATHSSSDTWEYGDCSCAMGCASKNTCFNAPQSIKQGWSIPIATHFAVNTTAGVWYEYSIPAVELSDVNTVRIFPNWTDSDGLPGYYLSTRLAIGASSFMANQYAMNLAVHKYAGTSIYDYERPLIVGDTGLNLGGIYRDEVDKLVIHHAGYSHGRATVRFCRFTVSRETGALCFNGIDDDCNGFTDMADPGCDGVVDECGDGVCTGSETACSCPVDCIAVCGDECCTGDETVETCPEDCPGFCGDNICSIFEDASTCPEDCPGTCGDGICNSFFDEDAQTCPVDCPGFCGDGICNRFHGESCDTCRVDCPRGCTNPPPQSPIVSPSPPPPPSPAVSPSPPPPQSPIVSPSPPPPQSPIVSPKPPPPPSPAVSPSPPPPPSPVVSLSPPPPLSPSRPSPPNPYPPFPPRIPSPPPQVSPSPLRPYPPFPPRIPSPPPRMGYCGDGVCDYNERPESCPVDCLGTCGDKFCNVNADEDVHTCPEDCIGICGDGVCNSFFGETPFTCNIDCPGICGDGYCNTVAGEEPKNCAIDCPGYCGDGYCNELIGENHINCPVDCVEESL